MIKKLLLSLCRPAKQSNSNLSSFGKAFLFFLLFTCSLTSLYAQGVAVDYTCKETTNSTSPAAVAYSDISGVSGVTSIISGTFTDVANFTTSYPIGFSFVFNNIAYTNVYISDNGYIFFKAAATTPPAVTLAGPISATAVTGPYDGCIAAYGHALKGVFDATFNSDISYVTTGSAGNRVFTVQYKNMNRTQLTVVKNGYMNMQIRLYEADGRIEVQYRDFASTFATGLTGQVGLRAASNADVNNRSNFGASFNPTVAGNASPVYNSTLTTSSTYGPTANTTLTWTPCFNPTSLIAALQGDNTSLWLDWTAPNFMPAATGYSWEVRTSGLPGSGSPIFSGTTLNTYDHTSITGLTIGQAYTIYVRSACKTSSPWTQYITATVTPSCATPLTVPYYQDFESSVVPAIPLCTQTLVVLDQPMVTRNNSSGPNTPLYGFASKSLITGGATAYPGGSINATDTWWFSQGITLSAGGSYKLTYTYGGTREQAYFVQKMKVAYGASRTVAGMTTILADHPTIKNSPITFSVNFTVASAGTYYLGFNGYAGANNGFLQIDDISLVLTTCKAPTALTATQVYTNSANISWTPPVSEPAGGYQYYLATSSTPAPTGSTVPTGLTLAGTVLTTLTGLTQNTAYYYWVRSSCGGTDNSEWSTMGTFTTAVAPCTPAPLSVDSQGITKVVFGTISNTTVDEPGHYGDYSSMSNNVSQTTNANITLTLSIIGYLGSGYYTHVWVDWNNDGDFADTGEDVYNNGGAELPNGTSSISFLVPASVGTVLDTSGPHRMRIGAADSNTLTGFGVGQGPCYNGSYATFEDYTINVISPPPALAILDANSSTSTTFCSGLTSPKVSVTTGAGSFTSFVWSPVSGVTGTLAGGYFFNPTVTTVYTLTATVLTGGNLYTNTATYTVNVNPSPTPIVIAPVSATYCQGDAAIKLTATGGIISGVPIYSENFNGGSNTFTLVHNSVNGLATSAYWMLHPSPYSIPSGNTDAPITIVSNDSSQFYMSDSDIQGSSGNTNEELISAAFSLTGYNDANLSFWHYYKGYSNGAATVDISTNGGSTWTTLPGGSWTTSGTSQGSATGFVNVIINLGTYAFAGNTNNNVKIRFKYVSNYGYRWAVDNVSITGSSTSNTIWSPNTELYTDTIGTPYDGVSPLSVIYTKPSAAITYTATVTTPAPASCPATKTVAIAFTPLLAGTATGDQTVSCGGAASSITLSGYLPNVASSIARWESANNPTFTGAVTIAGSASQATLTPALIGTVSATTYYRAVIIGCNTVYSNTITITVNSNTWDGSSWSGGAPDSSTAAVVTGDLTIASDLSLCSLRILSGDVVVNSGVTLSVDNAIDTFGGTGTLTFNDTACLLQSASATNNPNTGNITYKRDTTMRRYDYTYWSTPVSPQTLVNLSPFTLADKYFWFNSTPGIYNWNTVAAPALTSMTVGLGYIVRGPQTYSTTVLTPFTGTFFGVPNSGNYQASVTKSASGDLNLIGNPYPSALDADAFITGNAGVFTNGTLGTTLYFWTHNTPLTNNVYQFNDYALYNFSGATGAGAPAGNSGGNNNAAPRYIAAGQSFMVKGVNTGTFPVTFTNAMRVSANNNHFFRTNGTTSLQKNRVWLDLKNDQGAYKEILVGYIENATNGFETGYDGEVLEAGNPAGFYSILDTKKLGIQGRALPFDVNDQAPLGIHVPAAGTYEIALSNFDGLFTDTTVGIYLEDKLLNIIADLRQGSYSFVSETGTFDTRFVLRFTNSSLAVHPNTFTESGVVVFTQNQDIRIETSNIMMQSVAIFDARGRLVLSKNNINSTSALLENVGLAHQVLFVQITSTTGGKVTKKIIF